jgi:two-component system, NtrC family, sensor histidine kinase HydH
MFRVKASEVQVRIPTAAVVTIAALVLAFALNAAAVYQVFEEHRLLGFWLARPGPVSASEIDTLRRDIGTRIIVRSLTSAVLLLCTVAALWLQQRQLAIRRTLHQVKLLARDILAGMDQGVITTDLGNSVTSINSAALRILGLESDYVGRPLGSVSPGGAPLVALTGLVAERRIAVWDQDFSVNRAGRVRTIRADTHVLKDPAGKALGCIILLRDVSDRILMEDRVRRMERFLSLGALASALHHEIKNPLTALSIHVQLLEKRLKDPAPKRPVEETIGVLKSEVLRLTGVLESFRDFASLQRLNLRQVDASEVLGEVARLIGPQAEQHRVEVTLRRPEGGALACAPLDVEKIKQAVLNLVINALDVMPEGGALVLGAAARDGELLVEVSDTGPGIPEEIQGEVFKPYFSTKNRGTGMGLALTEKLVGQHGGRIDFRTGPQGTTFRITLPLEPSVGGDSVP